jgi:hypothetical protein
MEEMIRRIVRESGDPALWNALSGMSATDLQTLLIGLYRARASKLTVAEVYRQYATNRFVAPTTVPARDLAKFEIEAYDRLPPGYEPVSPSPVAPLGTCSVLGKAVQDKILTTIRNTEVCADSTNVMALESARRRRSAKDGGAVKLACFQRLLRTQRYDNSAFSPHFGVFCLTTAGRMTADYGSLLDALREHIDFYLGILHGRLPGRDGMRVGVTAINVDLAERLHSEIVAPLSRAYPRDEIRLDPSRRTALEYYRNLALSVELETPSGGLCQIVDGGDTDWMGKLLNDRKEFFLTSCIGVDLFLKLFGTSPDRDAPEATS